MIGLKLDQLTEAEAIALATALNVPATVVRLFTNNLALTRDLEDTDFTPATFVGYVDFPTTPDWEAVKDGANQNLAILKTSPLFQAGAIIAPFETIFGMVVLDPALPSVKFAARFTNPILVNTVGQTIQFALKWNFEQNEFEMTEIEPDVNP